MSQQFQTPINIAQHNLHNSGSFFKESGDYLCVAEKAEFMQSKTNTNNVMLVLTLLCTEGAHKGERAVDRLNIYHPDPVTQKIAHEKLHSYVTAMGADPILTNTSQLTNKPFLVSCLVSERANPQQPNKTVTDNEFSNWRYPNGADLVRGQYGVQGQQQQGGYGAPQAPIAPVAPAVAPPAANYAQAPVAPVAPVAPAAPAPQAQYADPAQAQYAQAASAPQYAQAPAAPVAPVAPVAPAAPAAAAGFAPPAGAAPFAPPAG